MKREQKVMLNIKVDLIKLSERCKQSEVSSNVEKC